MRKLLVCLLVACGDSASEQPVDAGIDAAPPLFAHETYFKASNTAANDGFGPLALSRGRLVVGAPGRGAAYAFSRRTSGWEATQTFAGGNTVAGEFGAAVAISADDL